MEGSGQKLSSDIFLIEHQSLPRIGKYAAPPSALIFVKASITITWINATLAKFVADTTNSQSGIRRSNNQR